MITLPNGLKSSTLEVAISFFKHCNKKCSLWIARANKIVFWTFDFLKKILQRIGEKEGFQVGYS